MPRRINIGAPAMTNQQIDRDVEAMLRKSQPHYFSGEGDDVGEQLEEWFEKIEEYFDLAHSSEENKAMMGRFKLEKSAKLWWKDHCKENALDPGNMTWDYLSTQLAKNYQTRTYRIDKLNEFLDSVQGKDSLDLFYQRFLKQLKYAPAGMDQERAYQERNPNHIPLGNNRNFNQQPANVGNEQGGNRQNLPHPQQGQGNQRPNVNVNPRNLPPRAQVHHLQGRPEENTEVGRLNAAIEHQGPNRQYAVLQTPAEYEGKEFKLLIDSGATHSFISPGTVRKLSLVTQSDSKLTVELATGKRTHSTSSVGNLNFKLGGHMTKASFRVLPLGIYDGILGMDWLTMNDASLECRDRKLSFTSLLGERVTTTGTRGDPKLHLVTAAKLLKTYHKGQMIYAVKLNPNDKPQPAK